MENSRNDYDRFDLKLANRLLAAQARQPALIDRLAAEDATRPLASLRKADALCVLLRACELDKRAKVLALVGVGRQKRGGRGGSSRNCERARLVRRASLERATSGQLTRSPDNPPS